MAKITLAAMSMISYAAGAEFINLLGGEMLSFYNWYRYYHLPIPTNLGRANRCA